MRFGSLEHYGLSAWRLACTGVATGSAAFLLGMVAFGGVLGQAELPVLLVLSAFVFYLVSSTPRRLLDRRRVLEAREAVLLSAAAKACLEVTGSRSRTLSMLKSRESGITESLRLASRMVILGTKVEDALAKASTGLAASSSAATFRSIATLDPEGFETGDEEAQGLALSSDLSRETRIPIFMTACFFGPIMTILYAVFLHVYDAAGLAELVALEFVLIDVAFFLGSAERGAR